MRKLLGPALAVLMVGAAPVAAQDPAELVTFDSRTYPGGLYTPFMPPPEAGSPATILGILRLPGGEARVPAVILAHGCSGLSGTEHYWARTLRDAGIATFQVNSFSGRGIASICRGTQPINMASVMTDVYRALAVLAAHPRIDGQRVALMGFSFGGRTALWASHPRFRERYAAGPLRFAAHIAVYPASCYIRLADEGSIADVPIRILHGTDDDWTPIAACRDYAARLRGLGKDIVLVEYAGAAHSFDSPAVPARWEIPDVMNPGGCVFTERDGRLLDAAGDEARIDSPCVVRGGSVGQNPAARQQATADVLAFLGGVFGMR